MRRADTSAPAALDPRVTCRRVSGGWLRRRHYGTEDAAPRPSAPPVRLPVFSPHDPASADQPALSSMTPRGSLPPSEGTAALPQTASTSSSGHSVTGRGFWPQQSLRCVRRPRWAGCFSDTRPTSQQRCHRHLEVRAVSRFPPPEPSMCSTNGRH